MTQTALSCPRTVWCWS